MKQRLQHLLMTSIIFMICYSSLFSQTIPNDSLYLGQIPPGNTPKLFKLTISSGLFAAERIAVSSDGKEIYFSELNNYPPTTMRIKYFKYSNNRWNGPFNLFEGYMAPGFSLNGDTMFVEKLRNGVSTPAPDTYCSLRNSTAWGIPFKFMQGNQSYMHYIQITNLGHVYLSSNPQGNIGGLDWCKFNVTNKDTTIQSLGIPLNTSGNDTDFYIARDESFMIISSPPSSTRICNGYLDLFISYRKNDDTWTNPKNLGTTINVRNTSDGRWGPYVTLDKKYLFYSRGISTADGGINWVRIDNVIDSLKHTNFIPYIKNNIPNLTATVNSLFNYTVPDNTFIDDDGNNTLTYTASYNSGDPLPSWLSFDPVTRTFSGTPTAPAIGRYSLNLKVTATDNAHESISCNFNLSVLDQTAIENNRLPKESKLFQNYPNPFNPTTVINYSIASAGNVTLKIDNVLGKEIVTLVNAYKQPGDYEAKFDGTNFSSGVYFYRIQTENFAQIRKMILIK